MTYYVTKYGLSQGILEMPPGTELKNGKYLTVYSLYTDEFETSREEAIARVEKLRQKRIAALAAKKIKVVPYGR